MYLYATYSYIRKPRSLGISFIIDALIHSPNIENLKKIQAFFMTNLALTLINSLKTAQKFSTRTFSFFPDVSKMPLKLGKRWTRYIFGYITDFSYNSVTGIKKVIIDSSNVFFINEIQVWIDGSNVALNTLTNGVCRVGIYKIFGAGY